ncbi:MAG: YitT family protein [Bacilli bacterium]|nr:YitT family protein [Bacilli bacterium]
MKKNQNHLVRATKKIQLKRYIQLVFGVTILALAFNLFILPNNFVYGGVSGVAIITQRLFGLEPSSVIFVLSILLLVVSYFALGKEKTAASVLGSLLFPVVVKLTSNVRVFLDFDVSQPLLCAVFGGVIAGLGAGFVFKAGFTSGGTDIINQVLSKYFKMSLGKAMMMSDGLILLCGTFIFGINNFMYAIIVLYLISIMTDRVLLGISDSKAFYIVTENDKEVRDFVIKNLSHGVTIFEARGGYNNKKQKVLFCVIPTKEYFKLKEGISLIDEKAFFVVTDAYEVYGGE